MVKIVASNAGSAGLIPGQGVKSPHASWPKNQNINKRSYTATKSINTFKN